METCRDLRFWESLLDMMVEHVEKYNVPVMPYQFDSAYSWRKQLPLIEKDMKIAETNL